MNAHPSHSRGAPSSGRAAVFFLTVWLVTAALIAIPVVLLFRDTIDMADTPSASGDSTTPSGSSPPTTPGTSSPTPSGSAGSVTATATAPPPSTSPSTTPSSLTMTVIDTCGADGTGDCFLTLRAGASGSSTDLGRMIEGMTFVGECWVSGQSVRASASGVRTSAWVRLPEGTYVSGAYVSRLDELPAC